MDISSLYYQTIYKAANGIRAAFNMATGDQRLKARGLTREFDTAASLGVTGGVMSVAVWFAAAFFAPYSLPVIIAAGVVAVASGFAPARLHAEYLIGKASSVKAAA